jgi:23S rRNA-/tRNA-specific pseudouridylate synthase/ubiquinone/menaquinone biosynthesis C-methylase UbiE
MYNSDSRSDRGRPPFGNDRGGGRPPFGGGNGGGRGGPPRGRPMGRPMGRPDGRQDFREEPRMPKPPKADVVFKDDAVCVVNKPAGLPIRGESHETLRESVWELGFVRKHKMRPAHEIDTLASGAVLLVRTRDEVDTPRQMTRPETNYLVLVEGEYDEEVVKTGSSINGPVEGSTSSGANPVTHFRVIASGGGLSLLQVRARPDLDGQIRQHLAKSGHPILGDRDLGSTRDDLHRLAMHAFEVRYEDPETEKINRVRVPAPHSFWSVIGAEPAVGMASEAKEIATDTDKEGWDKVAGWYDDLLSVKGSDHHENLVLPGVTRLLDLQPNERVLDVACGQGLVSRHLINQQPGATAVGVDLSPSLIERATGQSPESITYQVGDARELGEADLGNELFDAAACVLALMNIDRIDEVFEGISSKLRPGGRFVAVILHPAFRNPGATAWGWITDERTRQPVQFRRVDQYMSERTQEIVMNPGQVSSGAAAVKTHTYHRPMAAYMSSIGKSGMLIDTVEEWSSKRQSQPGPRAHAENTAREEIPMFMAIRAIKAS